MGDYFSLALDIVWLKIPALIGEWSVRMLWIEEYLGKRRADKAKRNQTTRTKDQLLRRCFPFVPQGKRNRLRQRGRHCAPILFCRG
jgi:hypothetical protein